MKNQDSESVGNFEAHILLPVQRQLEVMKDRMKSQSVPNAAKVSALLKACLFDSEKDITIGVVFVEGVVRDFVFDPDKLKKHQEEILEQISGLPSAFSQGWSFLQACMSEAGEQWGEHSNIEELMVLGLAIGKVEYCLPKATWYMLPGGMPYFRVK